LSGCHCHLCLRFVTSFALCIGHVMTVKPKTVVNFFEQHQNDYSNTHPRLCHRASLTGFVGMHLMACKIRQIIYLITFRYSFPCRLEACQSIISLIQAHTDMDIVLGIDSLGKGRCRQVSSSMNVTLHTLLILAILHMVVLVSALLRYQPCPYQAYSTFHSRTHDCCRGHACCHCPCHWHCCWDSCREAEYSQHCWLTHRALHCRHVLDTHQVGPCYSPFEHLCSMTKPS